MKIIHNNAKSVELTNQLYQHHVYYLIPKGNKLISLSLVDKQI